MLERNRIILAGLTIAVVCASGCSHIAHRADVEEGVNVSLMAAPSLVTYDPPDDHYSRIYGPENDYSEMGWTDFQMSLGYAWKFRNNRKLMPQVNLVKSSEGGSPFFSAGLYYQATPDDSPQAAGIGAIIGLDPMVYLIWGRDFVKNEYSKRKVGIDLGLGFGTGPSFLLDYKLLYGHELLSLGFFTEYRYVLGYLNHCNEFDDYNCFIKSRWSFGIILIHSPGKRNKRYGEYP